MDSGLWKEVGDLVTFAERAWVHAASGSDLHAHEAFMRTLGEVKADLGIHGATPLEKLLIDRIALCWFQVYYCDIAASKTDGVTTKQAEFTLKRQGAGQRRFLMAVGALATLRRLLPSAAQPVDAEPKVLPPQVSSIELDDDATLDRSSPARRHFTGAIADENGDLDSPVRVLPLFDQSRDDSNRNGTLPEAGTRGGTSAS